MPVVDLRHRPDHLDHRRSGGRGWRRRWRWRRDQVAHQLLLGKCFRVNQRNQHEYADQGGLNDERQYSRPRATPVQLRVSAARFQKAIFKHKPVLRLSTSIDTGEDAFAPEIDAPHKKRLLARLHAVRDAYDSRSQSPTPSTENRVTRWPPASKYFFTEHTTPLPAPCNGGLRCWTKKLTLRARTSFRATADKQPA